jgi:hypothetical protein
MMNLVDITWLNKKQHRMCNASAKINISFQNKKTFLNFKVLVSHNLQYLHRHLNVSAVPSSRENMKCMEA